VRRLPILAMSLLPLLGGPARAEIAVLANGRTLKLDGHREREGQLVLALRGGGELMVAPATVRGFVPDEVIEEIAGPGDGDLRELAVAAARRHGVDPELVLAVVAVESGFRKDAVSPKGAQGLMQLMPGTASALGIEDAFDPAANLDGGTRHLGALLLLYGGDLRRALAAYNGGVPPYRETREYVRKVLDRYRAESGGAGPAGWTDEAGRTEPKDGPAVAPAPERQRGGGERER
jgi:hypothetical protein